MQDSPRDQPAVVDIIVAYIRDHAAPEPTIGPSTPMPAGPRVEPPPPTDIQAALTIIGTRNVASDGSATIDLSYINLIGVDLNGDNFAHANFDNVDLFGSEAAHVNFSGANLETANLTGTSAHDSNFSGANLFAAIVDEVDFAGADLAGADFTQASFIKASFAAPTS